MRMSGFYWLVAIVLLAGCGKKPRPNAADELHRAAQNGDLGQVQALIARGVPVDARGLSDTTALHDAAWSGNVEVAEILVRCGARVDSVDSQGRTPIMVAMSRNHRSIVEDLVRAGATVNLHPAAYLGDVGRVRNLIDNGADITTRDRDGWTPLDYAVLYDHKEVAKLLLAAAADPNGLADGGVRTRDCVRDALRCALREGYEDMAELLINNSAPRGIQGGAKETPLYWAAEYGRLRTVKLLLAKGANVNASTREGYKPLGAALGQGYADIVETLIAAGADVNVRDKAGRTLFTEAVTSYCEPAVEAAVKKKFGDSGPGRDAAFDAFARDIRDPLIARMVVLLVAHGADINEKDEAGVTPLHHAAEGGLKETVGFLLAQGAEVNVKTTGPRERRYETHSERVGTTPLHMAAAGGDANTVKVLLAHGAELEARDQAGETPLHYAVLGGNARVVEILTGQGADAKAENNEGVAPLLNALGLGHVRMAKVLIAAGARRVDVKAYHRKSYGTMIHETVPLLHEALNADSWIGRCARSDGSDSNEGPIRREWIELLFANGADPNERDGGGDTALHSAILLGDDESARLFIAHGADVNARNKSNVTPLHCAAKDNRAELASLLLVQGADVNVRDNGGETPLHTAALRGHREVIEVLLAHGADVNAKNARGRTPADEAARRGHKDIVSLLMTKATYLHER